MKLSMTLLYMNRLMGLARGGLLKFIILVNEYLWRLWIIKHTSGDTNINCSLGNTFESSSDGVE